MQGKSLPRKIKEKILDLFQQGFGYCAVAKILGLNESTIKTYSLLYRSGDETSWVNSKAQKTNPQVLFCQANKFIPRENDKNYPALVS